MLFEKRVILPGSSESSVRHDAKKGFQARRGQRGRLSLLGIRHVQVAARYESYIS
jgi:hypothetical protein